MKPECRDYLDKARHCLANAAAILKTGIPDVAAREAYLAAFHAAEAYIFERMGKPAKTHRGVKNQFGRLALDEPVFDRDQLSVLTQGYDLKAIADYGIGPSLDAISSDAAGAAINRAQRFVDIIARLLSDG